MGRNLSGPCEACGHRTVLNLEINAYICCDCAQRVCEEVVHRFGKDVLNKMLTTIRREIEEEEYYD